MLRAKPKHVYLAPQQIKNRIKRHKNFVSLVKTGAVKPENNPMWGTVKPYTPGAYDQGQLGSCTANAFCHAYRTMCTRLKNADAGFNPSRLYLYYQERLIEDPAHNPANLSDTGADVVDGASYVQQKGICSEQTWPYDITKYNNTPPVACDTEASKHKIKGSYQIPIDQDLIVNIESTICSGSPVMIAVSVYNSFESDQVAATGMVPVPKPTNWNDSNDPVDPYLGGHEMCLVGYSRDKQLFTVLNSWGAGWGKNGFCYIPYSYLTNPNLGLEFTVLQM